MTAEYEHRLQAARTALAAVRELSPPLPGDPGIDQVAAAGDEAMAGFESMVAAGALSEPDRLWATSTTGTDRHDEVMARAFAAVSEVVLCSHLRHGGAQPVTVLLANRLMVCRRCVKTHRRVPADQMDRCHLCGDATPSAVGIAMQVGPVLLLGDVCRVCADALGVPHEEDR